MMFTGVGCATAPRSEESRDALISRSQDALRQMKANDSSLEGFLDRAYGYAIFPSVGKGAWIVGGAYGRGVVFEQGKMIGFADLTQASVGLQAGGQTYMELVVFETKDTLENFKSGKLTFAANVSAVILKTGAASAARFTNGIAVFVNPIGGAMVEAALGGQQFTFQPI
jgi:lipid-binding SYLF domain-containing protein